MKNIYLLLVIGLFSSFSSYGQQKSVEKVINQIDFQNDTLLAVFNWVTDNVKYDMKKAKDQAKGVNAYKKGNFKSLEEYEAARLEKVIKKNKGVCEDYTLLFNSILNELGYTTHTVTGLTKKKKKGRVSNVSHAWSAVKVNGKWRVYDTTWGAGYVNDRSRFVKKYFAQWYDVDPEEMKERHFPYDPIWQLSSDPMTFAEFKKGTQSETKEDPFDYEMLIDSYLKEDREGRSEDELSRLEKNKSSFSLIRKHIDYLKANVTSGKVPAIFEQCGSNAELFGEYINQGKNKQFKGPKWTKEFSKSKLEELKISINQSIASLKGIKTKNKENKQSVRGNITQAKKLLKYVDKELIFLK